MAQYVCCHFILVPYLFVLATNFHFQECCSPVQEAPGLRQKLQGLDETLRTNNFATLDLTEPDVDEKATRRAAYGYPFLLSTESDRKLHMKNNFSVIWEYNNKPLIFPKMDLNHLKNDCSNTFALKILEDSIELIFYNITPAAVGKHRLIVDEGHGDILYSTTYVRFEWNFTDVFYRPMINVTANVGETVHLRCYVLIRSGENNNGERIIWRHHNSVLQAPADHQMAGAMDRSSVSRSYAFRTAQEAYNAWSTILTIKSVSVEQLGRYECWFKPDISTDEWLIQSSYLLLKWTK